MKSMVLCLAVYGVSLVQVSAQSITANDLLKWCNSPNDTEERAACIMTVSAFMNGFIEGVGHGILGVFIHDPSIRASVDSVPAKEVSARVQQVNDRILCIQKVSVGEVADAYVKRTQADETMRTRSYREALYRTIAGFCK